MNRAPNFDDFLTGSDGTFQGLTPYVLTPQAFRDAWPELASRAWIEEEPGKRWICYPNTLTGTLERIQCDVSLCQCNTTLVDGFCPSCEEPWSAA